MDIQNQITLSETFVDDFVSELLKKRGEVFLSEEERNKESERLKDEVETKIEQAILEALPDKYLEQMYEESQKEEAAMKDVTEIIEKSKIDTRRVIEDALEEISKGYLGGEK